MEVLAGEHRYSYTLDGRLVLLYQGWWASLVAQMVKNPPTMQKTWVQFLDWEDSLKKGVATHSNILAWRIPWTEEPSRLQSMGSQSQTQLSDLAHVKKDERPMAQSLLPPSSYHIRPSQPAHIHPGHWSPHPSSFYLTRPAPAWTQWVLCS